MHQKNGIKFVKHSKHDDGKSKGTPKSEPTTSVSPLPANKEGSATDMRFERTALYAAEHGFQTVTTTNATSRWKDAGHGIIYHLPPERCGSWMLDVYFSLAALDLWTLRGVLQTGSIFGIGLGSKF